jgi:hypothetical protein
MEFVSKPTPCNLNSLVPSDVDRKPSFRNKKMHYTRQRTQRSTFKRRKLFDRHSVLASEFGTAHGKGNTKKVTGRDSHAVSLEGLFKFHPEFGIHVISCFVTYLRVMIRLQQTRGLVQRHSRNLVGQMIAMVKFYSSASSFNLLLSIFSPEIAFISCSET